MIFTSVGFKLILWIINFAGSLIALFISLYLGITHDDLRHDSIEPIELSNTINQVRLHAASSLHVLTLFACPI